MPGRRVAASGPVSRLILTGTRWVVLVNYPIWKAEGTMPALIISTLPSKDRPG